MEIRLLRYFMAVADELHFSRAAEKLHISQPPLSQQIKKLEEELGAQLFIRNKRKVHLTEAGIVLKDEAKKILRSIENARNMVTAAAGGKRGKLLLGYMSMAMDGVLPDIIREFKTCFPEVQLMLHEISTSKQLIAIKRGDIQLGVVRLFEENLPEFVVTPLSKEGYLLVLPSDHRLSKKKYVTIRDLTGEPMIFTPKDEKPRLWAAWHKTFAKEGINPNIVQETYSKHTSMALVAAGIGLTFIPESTARMKPKGVVFKKLQGKMPALNFSVVYLKGPPNPIINNFLSVATRIKEDNQSL